MNSDIRNVTTDETTKRSRYALAQITYPEKFLNAETHRMENYKGWLLYVRPTYYATNEPRDVRYYAESNAQFPHQSTGDQMYDEKQFEAYRSLGFLTMEEVIGDTQPNDLTELFDSLQEQLD